MTSTDLSATGSTAAGSPAAGSPVADSPAAGSTVAGWPAAGSSAATGTGPAREPAAMRALRLVALLETVSFAVLLTCSVLKRTTDFNAVPVMGPIHGVLFLALVALVLDQRRRLAWSGPFTALMLTLGSPGAHFAVRASRPS